MCKYLKIIRTHILINLVKWYNYHLQRREKMQIIQDISRILSKYTSIDEIVIYLVLISIVSIIIIKFCTAIICQFALRLNKADKREFIFIKRVRIIGNLVILLIILNIWHSYISDFLTFISFFSAGVAIALRDFIFNFFCGIYIKANKPFLLEDRIEIGGHLGDVIDIRSLSFSLLEINEKEPNGQSTGVIINCPNSLIFTEPLRNFTIGFKYIWNEIEINIPLTADIKKTKSVIYRILNQNEILKRIPKKMENEIHGVAKDYRIYYNKLDPIIYTKLNKNHITLQARYLVHPKKARNVEDMLWNAVLNSYKKGEIELFTENS